MFFLFQLEAKNKANSEKIGNGEQTELTDFDIKKMEKEKEVEELKVQQSEKQLKVLLFIKDNTL